MVSPVGLDDQTARNVHILLSTQSSGDNYGLYADKKGNLHRIGWFRNLCIKYAETFLPNFLFVKFLTTKGENLQSCIESTITKLQENLNALKDQLKSKDISKLRFEDVEDWSQRLAVRPKRLFSKPVLESISRLDLGNNKALQFSKLEETIIRSQFIKEPEDAKRERLERVRPCSKEQIDRMEALTNEYERFKKIYDQCI
jgi:hypothetical protein